MSRDIAAPPVYEDLRITIPAIERLEAAGNAVTTSIAQPVGPMRYSVELTGIVPRGLVLCLVGHGDHQHRALRCDDEQAYPQEWPADSGAIAWHERGDWTPCPHPKCGRALVWYEAGYVPGYRLCTRGHHAQLSTDGRAAKAVQS